MAVSLLETPVKTAWDKPPADAPLLRTAVDLFAALNHQGLRYCRWKSNLRLAWGLQGITDLDLLIDPAQKALWRDTCRQFGIIRCLAPPGKRYPMIEDYLGFDPESGRQFHLHVHYQLVLGEQFVKNYRLPLEEAFLDSVSLRTGVKIPAPELELIVLSLRTLLKYRDRDVIKDVLTIRTPGIPDHIAAEIDWLLAQTTPERIRKTLDGLADRIDGRPVLDFLATVQAAPRDGRRLFHLRTRVRRRLRVHQRAGRLQARGIYLQEMWRRRQRFQIRPARKMTLPGRGVHLAFVGVDGAGKTTLTREIAGWLGRMLDARLFYLGSKQPSRLSRWTYIFFRIGRRSQRALAGRWGENSPAARWTAGLRDTFLYSHYLFTGIDRWRRVAAGRRHVARGGLVINDRFPLEAPLDGPQIHLCGRPGPVRDFFVRLERRLYDQMPPPDLLLALDLPLEVAARRKPDHDPAVVAEKKRVLEQVTAALAAAGSPARLVRIDAGRPLAEVMRQVEGVIWEQLR